MRGTFFYLILSDHKQGLGRICCQRDWPLTWPHQGAILENIVPFQICNGPFQISNRPQLWLVKLCASLCIDKYHFLDLCGLCNMKKQIVKPIIATLWLNTFIPHFSCRITPSVLDHRAYTTSSAAARNIYTTAQD